MLSPQAWVEYSGTWKHGSIENNNMEGNQGFQIESIGRITTFNTPDRPNVVLLMLGTNNVVFGVHFDQAPQLPSNLVDFVFETYPGIAVLVVTNTPVRNTTSNLRRKHYITALPLVVDNLRGPGKKVCLVSMDRVA